MRRIRLRLFLGAALLAQPGVAQPPASVAPQPGARVTGIVHDSIAGAPLRGATVQLVAIDNPTRIGRTVSSDSSGRFAFGDVSDGRYLVGFFHPMLDSLGLDPVLREIAVAAGRPVRADLAIPSVGRLRMAVCGAAAEPAESSAVVIGIVREVEGRVPAPGVRVSAEWVEFVLSRERLDRRVPRISTTTAANGWFGLCGVPRSETVAVLATRGADSTDRVEVEVPANGFVRRELYLGAARTVAQDIPTDTDTLARPTPRRRVGDGRLTGRVVTAVGARPIAGAWVSVPDGPETLANDAGEWTLSGLPLGTRMLEVRAVGYYPERRAVDVVPGAPPIRIALSTMKAVLDTVRITASRENNATRNGFTERSKSGMGRYLTPADIARHMPIVTSDLFRRVPGLHVDRTPLGETSLRMRGTFGGQCAPSIFINGHHMRGVSAEDIDGWVSPDEIAGIEVYAGAMVPPQFSSTGLSGCGSIVIWTQPRIGPPDRRPLRERLARVIAVAALGLAVGALVMRR